MTKNLITILLVLLAVSLSACDKISSDVSIVKNGTLEFDKGLTVGQAIDKYKYFKHTTWEAVKTENGKRVVNVTGELDVSRYPHLNTDEIPHLKSAYIKFQFVINQDKTFEMKWCGLGAERNDGDKIEPDERINLVKCMNTLKEIYNNEPKEASAEQKAAIKAAASEREGCAELQSAMRNSKTLMEAHFADNQKYPDHVPFESAWDKSQALPGYISIKRIDDITDDQSYTIKGASEKCSKAYQTSSAQAQFTETSK